MNICIIFWSVILIATVIAETVTFQLVSIWFAVGALVALITASIGFSLLSQTIIFTAVSIILLCATRPIVRKLQVKNVLPTNIDSEVGKIAVVIQDISNAENTGRVKIGGVNWRARAEDNQIFKTGETVLVKKISGTTAYVTKAEYA
ncbi:MAG: NfeD family protein [Oscillospiraceae bacterium]|nr:NfeD family protein [Oscillospiraceae bacterium]